MKIRLEKLIEKLEKLRVKYGNPDVVIDYDADHGWFNLEKVQVVVHDGETFINLNSSNEM